MRWFIGFRLSYQDKNYGGCWIGVNTNLIGSRKQCTYFVIKHEYATIGDKEKLQWNEDNWNDILGLWDIGS